MLWEHEEPVQPRDAVVAIYQRLLGAAALGFWDALEALVNGQGRQVDLTSGAYYHLPDEAQIREFRRRGLRYIWGG